MYTYKELTIEEGIETLSIAIKTCKLNLPKSLKVVKSYAHILLSSAQEEKVSINIPEGAKIKFEGKCIQAVDPVPISTKKALQAQGYNVDGL